GVQAYFRLGHTDGKLVAAALAVGNRTVVRRVTAGLDPHGIGEWIEWPHRICDPYGRPLRLNEAAMAQLASAPREEALETVCALAAATGVPRLYVHAPDTGEPVALSRYVRRL